jgi:hypothetical protein
MEPKWAEENLQTIRTLMERSALYRRALAPIMIFAGLAGIAGGLAGWVFKLQSSTAFVWLWLGVAALSLVGALTLVRRQALKDSEPFWSPPTRRVSQALLPAFFVGLVVAVFLILLSSDVIDLGAQLLTITLWTWLYGCAVHAAGFFMPRGVRLLGWIFVMTGCVLMALLSLPKYGIPHQNDLSPHLLMGVIFGGLHLAYGIYLYFTESKTPVA